MSHEALANSSSDEYLTALSAQSASLQQNNTLVNGYVMISHLWMYGCSKLHAELGVLHANRAISYVFLASKA
jgi:hypothetical protein